MSRLAFVDPETDRGEWLEAWARLRRLPELLTPAGDPWRAASGTTCPACCLDCGECWQYMGSVPYRDEMAPTHYVHQFRHRCARGALSASTNVVALTCGHRVYRNVLSSPGWCPRKEAASA